MHAGGRGFSRSSRPLTEEEKASTLKIDRPLLKRIISYLLPYWKQLLLALAAIVLTSFFSLLPSILTGRIIDEGLIGRDFSALLRLIAISFGLLIASNLIDVLESYINIWVAQHITHDMRNKMYNHLLQMSQRFFATCKQGDIITRMTSDISGVQGVIAGTLTSILRNAMTLVIAIIAMYQKNWILATVGIVIVPLLILPMKRVGKRRWEITSQAQQKTDDINQILNETLSVSGQMLVKLYTRESLESQRYEQVNAEVTRLNIRESMAGRWFRVVINTITNAGPMLIYCAGGLLLLRYGQTSLTIGDITVMAALLNKLYGPVNALLNLQVDIIRSMSLFSRIFEYYDMPIEIQNTPNAIVPDSIQGTIAFHDVCFAYDADQPILNGINFEVASGHCVALVGPSGAGKSTIANLIPRLYDVTSGNILLDERDILNLDITWLRQQIGVVTQDTYLFNGTIIENLRYANEEASSAEIEDACRKANIHEFIQSLPNGYETRVGNRGVKLSGGERQRVSIARVILKNPKILILDEATSALDSISERLIQQAIEPLLKGRTSLLIAHRLSTIMHADEILSIENGRISQRGTHEEMVQQDGIYRRLFETQFLKE